MDSGIVGVLGTVLGVLIAGPLTYHFSKLLVTKTHDNSIDIMQRQEYYSAASKFRATVIYQLSAFYPINQVWDKKEFPRIYCSIPKINSAAAEFRYLVTCKTDFDKAVSEYNRYCRETTEDKAFMLEYQTMDGKGRQKYREDFSNIVDHLLSFTDVG